ncbi:MAG TPA: ribosomal-processing cysteine protease Prp [Clostridiales bacterium]|nr:ribosomal-processing cysteine protease Prp [Clostridiales bacterium]
MIKVKVVRDRQGFIWEFTINGHAGYKKNGEDIVCAGVSAVAYTAVGALAEMAGISNFSEKDGYMKCSIPPDIDQHSKHYAKIILDAMIIGMKQIEYSYGKYVVVEEEEV